MTIEPIACYRGPLPDKFGIPRQAGLVPELRGRIVFEPRYRSVEAVRGLEGFDYLWLIWGFSAAQRRGPDTPSSLSDFPPAPADKTAFRAGVGLSLSETAFRARIGPSPSETAFRARVGPSPSETAFRAGVGPSPSEIAFRATVRPPRLGGNERIGVFASRSPFRPNGLGLSSVTIESVELDGGPVIHVLGADLMDGTPIYDIKPYVPYTDSHPEARAGFVDNHIWERLEVVFPDGLKARFAALLTAFGRDEAAIRRDLPVLEELLAQDPRPSYRRQKGGAVSLDDGPSFSQAFRRPAEAADGVENTVPPLDASVAASLQFPDERLYGMTFNGLQIRFTVTDRTLTVRDIQPA